MNFTYEINSYNKISNTLNVTYTHEVHGSEVIDINLNSYDLPQDAILEHISALAPYVKWKQLEDSAQVEAEKMVGMTGQATFLPPAHIKASVPADRPLAVYEYAVEEQIGFSTIGVPIYKPTIVAMTPEEISRKKAIIVNEKSSMIKWKRDYIKIGGVKVGDKWFHTDADSRIQFLGLIGMGSNITPNLQWKTMDGSFITMTPTLAQQVFAATAQLDIQVFGVAELHIQALKAAEDPNLYEPYLVAPIWPKTYQESISN